MGAHSQLSASAASRWTRCAGSVALTQHLPNTSSPAALAGTIGHELADLCIKDRSINPLDIETVLIPTDDGGAIKYDVPMETREAVVEYLAYLKSRGGELLSEVRIDYSKILGSKASAFGTSDAVILHETTIEIQDLKLGHKFVESDGNEQLELYALGVVDTLSELTGEDLPREVTLGIYQPAISRAGNITVIPMSELQNSAKRYKAAAKRVDDGIAALDKLKGKPNAAYYKTFTVAGESQCQWCKHAAHCPTLADATKEIVNDCKTEDFDVVSAPSLVDDAPLRKAYESIGLLEIFIKAVQDEVYSRAQEGRGAQVGVKFVAGRAGNRKWSDENNAALQLEAVLPAETVYTKSILSPAAAEKALKKAKVTSLDLTSLTTRSAPSKTLAPLNDPRPEWTDSTTDDFTN